MADVQYSSVTLSNSQNDKSIHQRCSVRKGVLKNFAVYWSLFFNCIKERLQHRCFSAAKFLRAPILKKSAYGCFWTNFRKWLFWTLFLDSRFQNHLDSVILQKYQSLSKQSFKHNSAHMSSLHLTSTLPFDLKFRMFVINGYYTKS